MNYWLVKSEPDTYSIDDLEREGETCWDGIRNYQARNNLRAMKAGDLVLFYHSSAKPAGVAGVAKVTREAHQENGATEWSAVDLAFEARLPRLVPLEEIRKEPALAGMVLVHNSRLSVQPVTAREFAKIRSLGAV